MVALGGLERHRGPGTKDQGPGTDSAVEMISLYPELDARTLASVEATPSRIPVLLGPRGAGKTLMLGRVGARLAGGAPLLLDLSVAATTPEACLMTAMRAFGVGLAEPFTGSAASAFELFCKMFARSAKASVAQGFSPAGATATTWVAQGVSPAGAAGEILVAQGFTPGEPPARPACLLLDEFTELRTLESYPGVRGGSRAFLGLLAGSPCRVLLGASETRRALRMLDALPPDERARFEVIAVTAPAPAQIVSWAASICGRVLDATLVKELIHLTGGLPLYLRHALTALTEGPGDSAVECVAEELSRPGGRLFQECRYTYDIRLHRARGYGVLKAILDLLARENAISLTAVARHIGRTPGSTKDYLTWLEDVDLVRVERRRYSIPDPLLRIWIRLYGRPFACGDPRAEVRTELAAATPPAGPVRAEAAAAPVAQALPDWEVEID